MKGSGSAFTAVAFAAAVAADDTNLLAGDPLSAVFSLDLFILANDTKVAV